MWQDLPSLTVLAGDPVRWIAECLPAPCREGETVRKTARSTVVPLTTDAENIYFKADHILPPPEAAIIGRLAPHLPHLVPRVLAVDEARGWSLTHDAGSTGPTMVARRQP